MGTVRFVPMRKGWSIFVARTSIGDEGAGKRIVTKINKNYLQQLLWAPYVSKETESDSPVSPNSVM